MSRSVIRSFTGSSLLSLKAAEASAIKRKVTTASKLRIENNPSIPVERRKLYIDGSVYEGGWTGDVWAGHGKLTSATGQVWEGEFRGGSVYKGSGALVFPNGDIYEGKWVDGKMEGQGKSAQTNGSYLEGEFKGDCFYNGRGVLVKPDGTVLLGIWKLGRLEGDFTKHSILSDLGISAPISKPVGKTSTVNTPSDRYQEVINPDGSVLKGEFNDGKIYNGSGTMHLPDGVVHEGTWVNGMMEGRGKQTTKKMCYVGELMNNLRHGYGISTQPDGVIWEGEWVQNKMHGQGKLSFPTGQVYEGQFQEYQRHDVRCYFTGSLEEGTWVSGHGEGSCELLYKDGSMLKGEFKEGKIFNGSGVMKYTNGTVLEGTWLHGCMEGEGKIVYLNNDVFIGTLHRGQRHGMGTLISASGSVYEGNFLGDKKNGRGKLVDVDGRIYEGSWADNERHGQGRATCEKGVVEGEFRRNFLYNGKGVTMYRFGTIAEGVWEKGVLSGTLTDSSGVAKTGNFKPFALFNYGSKMTTNESTTSTFQ